MLLYAIFVLWVVLAPLALAAAVAAGFYTGRGTSFVQAWGYLTLYVTSEVVGTVVSAPFETGRVCFLTVCTCKWINCATVYALLRGAWPYSSAFKVPHARVATAWCSALAVLGHWVIGKRIFVRLPENGVRSDRPIIVVMRHVSTNDVVLSPYVFGWKLGFNLRMVMKKELLWDPFIEASGTRCDNYFIDRWNKSEMDLEVRGVSQLMEPPYVDCDGRCKGITIYPEGTRLTAAKRAAVLSSMEKANSPHLEHARLLKCTLPPRTKGLLSLMQAGPDADLLFMGHVGYDDAPDLLSVVRGDIFNSPLSIRIWRIPSEDVPKDEAGKIRVILDKWSELDQWCHEENQAMKQPHYLENMIALEAKSQMYMKAGF